MSDTIKTSDRQVIQGTPGIHPYPKEMRRKNREITDRKEIDEVIRSERLMHIALVDGDMPFIVPVFYGFNNTSLYFHSAKAGTKIEILKRNNNVCFEICTEYGVIENENACDFEAKHRTVIGLGKASFVDDDAEKIAALDLIVAKFSDKKFEYPEAHLKRTLVVRIDIGSIKGKKYGM